MLASTSISCGETGATANVVWTQWRRRARSQDRRPVLEPVTDWSGLLEAGVRADRLGYDTLWTYDHLYPIIGGPARPDLRGLADRLAAWAQATDRRPGSG